MQAVWNEKLVAESEETIYLEGYHYFPPDSVESRYLRPSAMRTLCPWKGIVSYYTLEDADERSRQAA